MIPSSGRCGPLSAYVDEIVGSRDGDGITLRPSGEILVGLETPIDSDLLRSVGWGDGFSSEERLPFLGGPVAPHEPQFATAAYLAGDDSPDSLTGFLADDGNRRYAVPVYQIVDEDDEPITEARYSPVPGSLLVTFTESSTTEERDDVRKAALNLGFVPDPPSSLAIGSGQWVRFRTEPGRPRGLITDSLSLRDELLSTLAGIVDQVELDWFAINPQAQGSPPQWNLAALNAEVFDPLAELDPVPIAVLDGPFDPSHPAIRFKGIGFDAVDQEGAEVWNWQGEHDDAHGTAVAGIVGSLPPTKAPDPLSGVEPASGVAPGAPIIPIRVYRPAPTVEATAWDLATGIKMAIELGAQVINMSVAGYLPIGELSAAVAAAEEKGVVLVAGSGNVLKEPEDKTDEPPSKACRVRYPAAFSQVVAVGAVAPCEVDGDRRVSWQASGDPQPWASCYGNELDVVAPGLGVPTTDPVAGEKEVVGNYNPSFAGTSAASPHVAGLIARMKARFPDRSAQQIRAKLYASCVLPELYKKSTEKTKGSRPGYDNGDFHHEVGFGIPNAERALAEPNGRRIEVGDPGNDERPPDDQRTTEPPPDDQRVIEPPNDTEEPMPEDWPCTESLNTEPDNAKYYMKFKSCLRPLSAFLAALREDGSDHQKMLHDFWKDPFRTARYAGLPWQACIALAEFDRAEIDRLVEIEVGRNKEIKDAYYAQGGGSGGPIGVKLT